MKDSAFIFVMGVVFGVGMTVIIVSAEDERALKACASEHNIYACEFVAVPKQPDEVRK